MPLGGFHVALVSLLSVLHAKFWFWLEVLCGSKAASSFISSFQKYFVTQAMFSQITSFCFLLFPSNLGNGKTFFFKNTKCPPRKYCRKWCFHAILSKIFALTSFFSAIIWSCGRGSVPSLRAPGFSFLRSQLESYIYMFGSKRRKAFLMSFCVPQTLGALPSKVG